MQKSYGDRIKSVCVVMALALLAWPLAGSRVGAQSSGELSPEARRGKRIYLKGESDSGEIKARLGGGDVEVSAGVVPCASCHGLRGEGTSEAGLQSPSIIWRTLTSPQQSALTRQARGRYDETTLARAITVGLAPNGRKLHPGMPHYKLTGAQLADLIAYLKRLGDESDADVGLSADAIKVGAALPLTGPLANLGKDVQATLAAYFKEVNGQGGSYGRKFELVIADSHGDAAGTNAATQLLVEKEGVFALVGSFETGNNQATNEFLQKSEVPLVGPVTLSPLLPPVPNRYVFYLLPSFNDQARALVEFIAAAKPGRQDRTPTRLAVVYSANRFDQDALAGLKAQAQARAMPIVAEQSYETDRLAADSVVAALAAKKPDYIFFFGNGDDFNSFARELERQKLEAGLLTCATMVGRAALDLPARVAAKTYLAYSASLPDGEDFAEFLGVMQKAGVPLRSPAFQAVAYAGAKIFVEAAKASGRQLNRATLVNALEHLQNFRTGVLPPVTFSPNRRIGATGSYIVGVDVANKQYVPLSDRIVPPDSRQ